MLESLLPLVAQQVEILGVGICLLAILWFVIAILICIWVYRDAESRGMNGVLWLIVVLIAGLLGLIIYLIVRKEKTTEKPPPPPPPS